MATRPATELLYDSEASYRLVDNAIGEFGAGRHVLADGRGRVSGEEARNVIREELFGLIAHLHFHDISEQQLAYASSIIADLQKRFARIETMFESGASPRDEAMIPG